MGVIEYVDFDLSVELDGTGYRSRVLSAPAGAGATAPFPALDDAALKQVLAYASHPRDAVRVEALAGAALDEIVRIKGFGGGLFGALFGSEIGGAFAASRRVTAERATGLRLRLRVSAELAQVPWEYLYLQPLDRFMCLSVDTPLVRFLDIEDPVPVLAVDGPLRILVMISDPEDLPRLDVAREMGIVRDALGSLESKGVVTVERLGAATTEALQDRLLEGDVHVFHFIGHGGFDPDHEDGVLVFEGAGNRGAFVPGDDLGVVLHGHHSLRLAVLNTCQGATGSPRDPFAGTAQGLIQQGLPAVIGMQFPITDVAALSFARRLYSTLALGYPVDAALTEARKTVYLTGNRLEWATPVLYTRSTDGRLFSIEGAAPVRVQIAEVDPLVTSEGASEEIFASSIVSHGMELQLDGKHGALLVAVERIPGYRARRPPLDLRPRDFPDLLGRGEEVGAITTRFLADEGTSSEPVEIFGPSGVGKTALARNIAHHPSAQFPDGVVYTASRQSPDDLLRFLFQTFFSSDRPAMPSEAELAAALNDVEALVVMDDVELDRDQLERLMNTAPRCLFVLCSKEQKLWQSEQVFPLRGLSQEPAIQLLEDRLDRGIMDEEQPDARDLIEAVGGFPLLLVQAASRVRNEGLTIGQVAAQARKRRSRTDPLLAISALSEPESRVLAVLTAAGARVGASLLAAATGLPEATSVAESLLSKGLVSAMGDRFEVTQPAGPDLAALIADPSFLDITLEGAERWLSDRPLAESAILEEADALLGLMASARARARWAPVVRLGRAVERVYAIASRWDRWREVLEGVLEGARNLDDPAQEAWALHQLGTRHVGLDQIQPGREELLEALKIREKIKDTAGEQVTRANLAFAGGPPPPPPKWPWVLGAILVVGLIVGFLVARDGVAEAGIEIDPGSVSFGDREIAVEGDAVTVSITSTGDRDLQLGDIGFAETSQEFTLASDACSGSLLGPGTSCSITLAFVPSAEGERTATILVPHDAGGDPARIQLTGTGAPPDVEPDPPVVLLGVDGTPLEFPTVDTTQALTISNEGDVDVSFELELTDDTLQQFPLIQDCPTRTLGVGATCDLVFGYRGIQELPSSATIKIVPNEGDPLDVTLTGSPFVDLTLSDFDIVAGVNVDSSFWTSTVTVMNVGVSPFTIDEVSIRIDENITSGDVTISSENCRGETLESGEICTISVSTRDRCHRGNFVRVEEAIGEPHEIQIVADDCPVVL